MMSFSRSTALQHEVDLDRPHGVPARPREIQEGFDLVSELLDRRNPEDAGVPLDGVERTEDVVDELQIRRRGLEFQDGRFDRAEVIDGVGDEHPCEFGVGHERRELGVRLGRRRRWDLF